MKKKEAIYLHVLLCEVRNFMTERGGVRDANFAEYDDLGVEPIRFDLSKDEQEDALLLLAEELDAGLADEPPVPL